MTALVDAIGLEGMPAVLRLGSAQAQHAVGAELPAVARVTPVVDGSGVRPELERWGVILAERAHPLIFNHKRVLFVPGVNHEGLAQALARRSSAIRFADPQLFFGLPDAPGVGSAQTLDQAAAPTLEALKEASFETIAGITGAPHHQGSFVWADILAGNIAAIRRFAPERLDRKMVIVESASDEDIADLRAARRRNPDHADAVASGQRGNCALSGSHDRSAARRASSRSAGAAHRGYLPRPAGGSRLGARRRDPATGGGRRQQVRLRHPPVERQVHP
jgi:hypothetical protein